MLNYQRIQRVLERSEMVPAVKVEPDWDLQTAIWYVMVTATTVGAQRQGQGA